MPNWSPHIAGITACKCSKHALVLAGLESKMLLPGRGGQKLQVSEASLQRFRAFPYGC